MKLEFEKFQIKGIRLIHKHNGRVILADEMGLGKTIQIMGWWDANDTYPVVVVCPAFVKHHWESEIKRELRKRALVLEGRKPKNYSPWLKPNIVIINYDILPGWLNFLRRLDPQLVVLDEGQYIKSLEAKRTKAAHALVEDVPHVIIATGTPILSRPMELWSLIHAVNPKILPKFSTYAKKYCNPVRRRWGWDLRGASNLEELHEKLSSIMIRRTKEEALPDLPPKTRFVLPLPCKRYAEYHEAENDFRKWLRKHHASERSLKRTLRAKALTQMGYLRRLAAEIKMEAAMAWMDNFLESSNDKIILFAIHKKIVSILYERYKKHAVVIDGSTSPADRKRNVELFNKNKSKRILIGNIQAAGVGWSAKACSTVAFIELGWTPAEHIQAEDRIHGMYRGVEGQKAFIYYLVARNTIEERLCKLLQFKQRNILDVVLDGGKSSKFEIMNQLMKEIERGSKIAA